MSTQPEIKVIRRGGEPPRRSAFGKVVALAIVVGLAIWAYQKWHGKKDAKSETTSEQSSSQGQRGNDGLFPIPHPEFK